MRKRANNTGSVYKVNSGNRRKPWVAAKNKVIIGYYATQREAQEALDHLLGHNITDRYNMTFAEVYHFWSEEKYKEIKDKHVYEWAYKRAAVLHNRKFRDLMTYDFQAVIDDAIDLKQASRRHIRNLFKGMTSWAVQNGIIFTDYSIYLKLPHEDKKEPEIFSDLDIQKMKDDDSPEARMCLMMIYTGMRIGELYSLTRLSIHKNYLIAGEKTESGKNRVIPIPRQAWTYFQWFIDCDCKFPWETQTFYKYYHRMLYRLGIKDRRTHICRHTFASLCKRAGVAPEVLQRIMGHKKYDTTADIYIHIDRSELIKAVENL